MAVLGAQGRRKAAARGLAGLVGADVEVRTLAGGIHRGRLLAASAEWLEIEGHTGRRVLIRIAAVGAVVDEALATLGRGGSPASEGGGDA